MYMTHFYCTDRHSLAETTADFENIRQVDDVAEADVLFGLKEQSSVSCTPETVFCISDNLFMFTGHLDDASWEIEYQAPESCHFCSNQDISPVSYFVEFASPTRSSSFILESKIKESHKINSRVVACCKPCATEFHIAKEDILFKNSADIVSWVV